MVGYFGKVPTARDFIFHGLPTRATDTWAQLVSPWIAALKSSGDPHWQRSVLTSPVWRFLLPQGLGRDSGIGCCAGLMAGSVDGVGRVFPFAVLVAATETGGLSAPDAALDLALDRIEPEMLGFMEGQSSSDDFAAVLAREAGGISLDRSQDAAPPLPGDGDQGICYIGTRPAWSAAGCDTAYGLPFRSGGRMAADTDVGYWWHEGHSGQRRSQLCIILGRPDATATLPFFDPQWYAGWHLLKARDDQHL